LLGLNLQIKGYVHLLTQLFQLLFSGLITFLQLLDSVAQENVFES